MNNQINRMVVTPEELKDQPAITTLDQLFCMELMDLQMNREELLRAYYNRTLFLGRSPEQPVTVVYGTGEFVSKVHLKPQNRGIINT